MRILLALLLYTSFLPAMAADAPALTAARSLADQGAWLTAWNLIHDNAPRADQADWPSWETLRQQILAKLDTWPPEALPLLEADRHSKNVGLQTGALDLLLKDAQQRGDQNRVRQLALEALSGFEDAGDWQWHWREAVIDSYSAEGREHEAFVSMLRYQQDVNPLPKPLVADFVGQLLALGAENDARLWAGQLPAGHPYQLWFAWRLKALPNDQVIGYARQLDAKKADARYWQVIAAAAPPQSTLQLEALEHLVGVTLQSLPDTPTLDSKAAWDRLIQQGKVLGMQAQLIIGDDQPWLDSAELRSTSEAAAAHCLLAYLSVNGRNSANRNRAQARLFQLLDRDQLYHLSLALSANAPDNNLVPTARYYAGLAALHLNQFDTATQLWQALNLTPDGLTNNGWLSLRAETAAHSSDPAQSVDDLFNLAKGHTLLNTEEANRVIDTVQHLPANPHSEEAIAQVLPLLDGSAQGDVYACLGSMRLRQNNAAGAADALLRAIALKPANAGEWRPLALLALDSAGASDEATRLRRNWAPHPVKKH